MTVTLKVDVRNAFAVAHSYLQSIRDMLGNELKNLRLEEIELSEDKQFWLITLGFDVPLNGDRDSVEFFPSFTSKNRREYKIFKVSTQTGEVQSMKIREL